MNGHDLHIYHQRMDKSGYFRWRTLQLNSVAAAGETHTQGFVRVPFPFNPSNPPILGAPGLYCLQLPGPKMASPPATADRKHDDDFVPIEKIHDYMGKGRDIVLRVDIERAATKTQILGISSSHIMLIRLPSIMFSSNPNP